MPVVQPAPRERPGIGVILGGTEHVGLLAAASNAVTLQVGDVGRQRRRAEGVAPMADDTGLDDDTTLGAKEAATAERGPAAAEGRVAVPRAAFPPQRRTFEAGFPHRAQHLVDEAVAAAAATTDPPHQDLELVIIAVHACHPGYLGSTVPERGLRNRDFCLRVALWSDRRPAES